MYLLVAGVAIFVGSHLLPSFPGLRQRLLDRAGDKRYRAVFSLVALAGLVLMVVGKGRADFVPVYSPPQWGDQAALVLLLPALILLPAANMPTNIKRFTRHPMLWGLTLWSGGHLLANGDLASIILFGGLGAYALFDMFSANLRGAQKSTQRYPLTKDLIVVAAGLAAYVVLMLLHPYLFGVPV